MLEYLDNFQTTEFPANWIIPLCLVGRPESLSCSNAFHAHEFFEWWESISDYCNLARVD